ncbi:MAG: carboxypeptidase-like regulatory domain-containing protein [Sedimentisphaerales bacterium]|nr:carboxypeptidase-like regulatory domain-containing protein [Sedimentisphaerales bacterium]
MKVNLYHIVILFLFLFHCNVENIYSASSQQFLTVIIIDSKDNALSNVQVTEYETGKQYTTDENGRFICDLSDKVRYFYAVDKIRKLTAAKECNPGQKELHIEIKPGKIVTGMVVDSTGKPAPDTKINASPMTSFYSLSDNEGKFCVGWLEEWEPSVNMCLFARNPERNLAAVLDIGRQSDNVKIELGQAQTLAGTIKTESGTPIDNARIRLNFVNKWQTQTSVKDIFTNSEGHFEITGLPQKQSYCICVSHQNYYQKLFTTGVINKITEREDIGSLVLKAALKNKEDSGTLPIKVIDEYGRGLDDIHFMLWTQYEDGSARGFQYQPVSSGTPGLFEIRDIKTGQYQAITVDKAGYVRSKIYDIEVKQSDNQTITCVLTKGKIVEGLVTDEMNNPVAGVRVVVNSSITGVEGITDENGHFIVRHVPDVKCRVIVELAGNSPYERNISEEGMLCGRKDIHIILKKKQQGAKPGFISYGLKGIDVWKLLDVNLPVDKTQIKDKRMLLCFFDIQNRTSRHYMLELNKKIDSLKDNNIEIVAIQSIKMEQSELDEWLKENKIEFIVNLLDSKEITWYLEYGVLSLPGMLLTDKEHIVQAEGFSVSELDKIIAR